MYQRFTDDTRKVLQLANQEAQRFCHEYIGTEHILLALMKCNDQHVMQAIECGIRGRRSSPHDVVAEIEKLVQSGLDMVTMGKLPQTPRAKKVVELAIKEAGNGDITPWHLLLACFDECDGVAGHVLSHLGYTRESLVWWRPRDSEVKVRSFVKLAETAGKTVETYLSIKSRGANATLLAFKDGTYAHFGIKQSGLANSVGDFFEEPLDLKSVWYMDEHEEIFRLGVFDKKKAIEARIEWCLRGACSGLPETAKRTVYEALKQEFEPTQKEAA